jgi:hypothetical protein
MERGGLANILLAWLVAASFFLGSIGCNQSSTDSATADQSASVKEGDATGDPAPDPAEAAKVVRKFLQAVKSGDETTSNDLLTPLAREKTSELDMAVAPMGSESASFTVGDVKLPEEGGGQLAHVASTWTDIDDEGQTHTDEVLWVLRHEEGNWRIGGMATKVFEDQPLLLLNFEDPADMRRKQQLAEAELERRARAEAAELSDEQLGTQETEQPTNLPAREDRQAAKPSRPENNQ